MNFRKMVFSTGVMFALLLASAGARAVTNINATSSALTSVSLAAGTYQISWVGIAGGGLYDAWTYSKPISATGYREAFTMTVGSTSYTYDVSAASHYTGYASASDALKAFQTATSFDIFTTTGGTTTSQTVSGLPTFTLTSATTVSFGVPDNLFTDNTGGVSIALTAVPANNVPEPGSYTLAFAGLAAAAFARRRVVKS